MVCYDEYTTFVKAFKLFHHLSIETKLKIEHPSTENYEGFKK